MVGTSKASHDVLESILERPNGVSREAIFSQLLLAWFLFVKRGHLGSLDDDYKVSWTYGHNESCMTSLNLSDIFPEQETVLEECLEKLRPLFEAEPSANGFVACARVAGAEQNEQPKIAFQGTIRSTSISLILQNKTCELARDLAQVFLHSLKDIFDLVQSNPGACVTDCILVGQTELEKIWAWSQSLPPTIERTIHSYFSEQVNINSGRPAVVSWDGEFSYGELDELSTKLSHRLRRYGVASKSAVALCFDKSVWTIVAVLAVLKAGGAFVLLDPSQPEGRAKVIVGEVDARLMLTSEKHVKLGGRVASNVPVVSVGPELLTQMEDESIELLSPVDANELMYIIFTSGSTGKPKGVMITHANYTSGAIPRSSIVGYEQDTRVLDFASYAFDVSIDCMLLTLATGGCICVPSNEDRVNDLSGAIRKMSVNMVHTTPSIARVFDPDVIPSLKVLGLGGEPVPAQEASEWNSQTQVLVAYGPSECTVGCAFARWEEGNTYTSLGRGCGGVLWIVDPTDHNVLMPIGAPGELLVEGAIVGEGYINDPEKTAAAFIEDPEWLSAGCCDQSGRRGRLYKTGDLAKYDSDGSGAVVFVGRKDQQVKIRGQRVELEEVEYHLRLRLPTKTAAVAEVIYPGGAGDPMLAAFIVEQDMKQERLSNTTCTFSAEFRNLLADIEQDLLRCIPKYMVPASFIAVAQIPNMVSGKTDRKQLRNFGASLSRQRLAQWKAQSRSSQKFRILNENEQTMRSLWALVLGHEIDPRPDDTFFALGGDSLKAMRLVALCRQRSLSLTIGIIFANPTLEAMAVRSRDGPATVVKTVAPFSLLDRRLDTTVALHKAAEFCSVRASEIEDLYPCTPLQEGLMALSAKRPEAYVAQRVLRLADEAAAARFKTAMDITINACQVLRTRIVHMPAQGLMQVVLKAQAVWRTREDLEVYLSEDREDIMELGKALCRFAFIKPKDGEIQFVLTMHHTLYDGWSMPLVVDRINRAYHDLDTPARTPFNLFINHCQLQDRSVSELYWQNLLNRAGEIQFPSLPHAGYQPRADSLLEREIRLPELSNSNSTLATIIRGAWALIAAQHLQSGDVVFGETLTGRNADVPGIEEIEAPLITTVPMRVVLKDCSVSQYLQNIQQQIIDRMPHEHLGLQNIRLLSPGARHACDLRTGLVLHPGEDDSSKLTQGPACGLVPANDAEAAQEALKFNSYALMLVCSLTGKGFFTMASFDSNCVSVETMQTVLDQFERTIQALSSDENQILSQVVQLPKEDPIACSLTGGPEKQTKSGTTYDKFEDDTHLSTSQTVLKSLFASILRVDSSDIKPNSDFFDLGGDSIGAMKLVSELRSAGYGTTVAKIFASRQLASIDKVLELITRSHEHEHGGQPAAPAGMVLKQRLIDEKITPALSQPGWIVTDIYPARPLQGIAVSGTTNLPRYSVRYEKLFVNGDLDRARVVRSCQELVKINEILRTVFVVSDGRCYGAVIDDIFDLTVEYQVDDDVESFADGLCNLDIRTQNSAGSSFVKFFLISNKKNQHCLIFRLSHAQYDEMCLPLILQQLSDLYQRGNARQTLAFSSYVQYVLDVNMPTAVQYWSELLKDSQMSKLPGPPSELIHRKRLVSLTQSISLVNRPKAVTLASFPTAAWALCLSRRLRSQDVVFGEVASGRNIGFPNADSVAGPCWQYTPFRMRFDSSWTYLDLLRGVQAQHIASSQHEGIGLSELVEKCTDWRDVEWFDSVVHQAVTGTQMLRFGNSDARVETYYPHIEPLREWKVQAFAGPEEMTLELVTFEEWKEFGQGLLDDLASAFETLVRFPDQQVDTKPA